MYDNEMDDDHLATPAEADREEAAAIGAIHPEREWILSDRDVWLSQPLLSRACYPASGDGLGGGATGGG